MKLKISKAKAEEALRKLQGELLAGETKARAAAIEEVKAARAEEVSRCVRWLEERRQGLRKAKANLKAPITEEIIAQYMPRDEYGPTYNRRTGEYGPTKYQQTEIELRRLAMVEGDTLSITVESALGKLLGL